MEMYLNRLILAKLLKISVTDGYKGMGFQQIIKERTLSNGGVLFFMLFSGL